MTRIIYFLLRTIFLKIAPITKEEQFPLLIKIYKFLITHLLTIMLLWEELYILNVLL